MVFSTEISFSEIELQEKITKKLPIHKKKYFVSLNINTIDVVLKEGSDRIFITGFTTIDTPLLKNIEGMINFSGKVFYENKKGVFLLTETEVESLNFEKLPKKYNKAVSKITAKIANEAFYDLPIYKLKDSKLKDLILKKTLDRVYVRDKKVIAEF
jgi:hypothetical protein